MTITPVAHFHSPLTSKFGIPRQSGLVQDLPGRIVFTPPFRHAEALRGLELFDYLWLIWEFSANTQHPTPRSATSGDALLAKNTQHLTVRPPRLGGNERVGVFASRSPFRPNNLGLSCVRIKQIEQTTDEGPVIHVLGADLMDGTPIYDVKPYVSYADAHPEARSGFVDTTEWKPLEVHIPQSIAGQLSPEEQRVLISLLSQDPRPQFHHDPDRQYGMPFAGRDVRFRVADGMLTVTDLVTVEPRRM